MNRKSVNFLLPVLTVVISLFGVAPGVFAQNAGVKWRTETRHVEANIYEVVFTGDITPGFHLYDLGPYEDEYINKTVFTFEPSANVALEGEPFHITEPHREFDPIFEIEIGTLEGRAQFGQRVRLTGEEGVLEGSVNWSICDDMSCLPPTDTDFSVTITAAPGAVVAAETPAANAAAGNVETRSIWALIVEAILWGFAALLTPCVFPMVPMTVSFFMKGSENKVRGRFRAGMYGLFIILLYTIPIAAIIITTLLIGGESVTADIFNWLATHWLPNFIFFLVFMVFAASFFGAFEITMPGKLVNRTDRKADKGGLGGIFFMALTLVLVSFSCTGPIVGTVLIKSTQGEFWAPIITMFAFSVAFALPFTLLAFFPSLMTKLRSGAWLNSVKVVLGFIEVALGFKFLSVADQTYHWGILDREVYLAIWIVVFSLLGFYLLGKLKFKHDSDLKYIGVGRLTLSIIVFSFVVYMIPGMWGAPLKALSGYMPPITTQDFVIDKYTIASGAPASAGVLDEGKRKYSDILHLPLGLDGYFTLEEGLAAARRANKPVFIDFTGHGCVNCREMEARVWSDPEVLSLLKNEFIIVTLYSDDKANALEEDWIVTAKGKTVKGLGKINSLIATGRYGINAQPAYIIADNDGNPLLPARGYDLSIPDYVKFLRAGIAAYRAQERS